MNDQERVAELEAAITRVVTQIGDDLCWMDTFRELGALVGIPFNPQMLSRDLMLKNCELFVDSLLAGSTYKPLDERMEICLRELASMLNPRAGAIEEIPIDVIMEDARRGALYCLENHK